MKGKKNRNRNLPLVVMLGSIACFFAAFAIAQFVGLSHGYHQQFPTWATWVNVTLFISGIVGVVLAVILAYTGRNRNG